MTWRAQRCDASAFRPPPAGRRRRSWSGGSMALMAYARLHTCYTLHYTARTCRRSASVHNGLRAFLPRTLYAIISAIERRAFLRCCLIFSTCILRHCSRHDTQLMLISIHAKILMMLYFTDDDSRDGRASRACRQLNAVAPGKLNSTRLTGRDLAESNTPASCF